MDAVTLPTFTAIVTAHGCSPAGILDNLASQTQAPTQVLCAASDLRETWEIPPEGRYPFPLEMQIHQNKNDFGYDKRNRLLPLATGEFVGFFAHDDSYEPEFLELMLGAAEGKDVAFCWWDEVNQVILGGQRRVCEAETFEQFYATLGGFIVRTTLLRRLGGFPFNKIEELKRKAALFGAANEAQLGMPEDIEETAIGWLDGALIEMLRKATPRIACVKKVLYHHNIPYREDIRPMVWGREE
jgi:hypothetical protein